MNNWLEVHEEEIEYFIGIFIVGLVIGCLIGLIK
jgi:hypothetical protein